MANRKQELDKSVAQSRQEVAEREANMAPPTQKVVPAPQGPQGTPLPRGLSPVPMGPKTKAQSRNAEFKLPWSKREEAGSKAPVIEKRAKESIEQKARTVNTQRSKAEVEDAFGRQARIAAAKESATETKKKLAKDPQVAAKAEKATAKFLKRPKPTKNIGVLRVKPGNRK
jgi:hypothetical protein